MKTKPRRVKTLAYLRTLLLTFYKRHLFCVSEYVYGYAIRSDIEVFSLREHITALFIVLVLSALSVEATLVQLVGALNSLKSPTTYG